MNLEIMKIAHKQSYVILFESPALIAQDNWQTTSHREEAAVFCTHIIPGD